jgi:hypothetical protein
MLLKKKRLAQYLRGLEPSFVSNLECGTVVTMTSEQQARVSIDALLTAAGWHVRNMTDANIRTQASDSSACTNCQFTIGASSYGT